MAKKQTGSTSTDAPDSLNQLLALAQQCTAANQLEQAVEAYRKVLAIQPNFPEVYNNLGHILESQGNLPEAVSCYERAVTLRPDFAEAHNNLGNALVQQNRIDDAITCFKHAIAIKPDYAYAHNGLGLAFDKLSRLDAAAVCYERALALNPAYVNAYANLGTNFYRQRQLDKATACFQQALALQPNLAEAHNGLGLVLLKQGKLNEAAAYFERAISLKPDIPYLIGMALHTRMYLCYWQGIEDLFQRVAAQIDENKIASLPFTLLATPISMAHQQKATQIFIQNNHPPSARPLWDGQRYTHDRIRIGYFSMAFRNHPTSYLMAEFFERHDRSKFEVTAFAYGPPSQDAIRKRLENAFEHFVEVNGKTDREIAELARSREIDIAIDLDGFTGDGSAKTGIFACRCAPVQVNYLGFPCTMGASYIDYMIADPTVIPEEHKRFYTEKIAYLPYTYQLVDSSRTRSENRFTRTEMGLPENGFVFCCFNSNYKITPDVFDIWMRLLRKVEGSVLWLFAGNPDMVRNLQAEAKARGISFERLVFAPWMDQENHLARQRLADLLLDTFYCNAHTTASDALWEGLPVLTCLGQTFAGRVAASLLNAVNLPELITHSHAEYEALALELAAHPQKLAAIRQKLIENRAHCPLFNTKQYTRYVENALTAMWEKSQAGAAPDHIYVKEE